MNIFDLNVNVDILLIIECCKDSSDKSKLENYSKAIINWNEFINLSKSHGVFPLVYKELKYFTSFIPKEIILKMKMINLDIAKQNMLMTSELIKISNILEQNTIDFISLKGPTLAHEVYGDISLRQYCDLDLLVKVNDINSVTNLLQLNGYKSIHDSKHLTNKNFFNIVNEFSFFSSSNVHIELHWSLFKKSILDYNDFSIWNERNSTTILDKKLYTINTNDYLIYLCIHGSKHLWERIEWLTDIHKLISLNKIDWDYIISKSEKLNSKKLVLLGLILSHIIFNTKIPSFVYEQEINKKEIKKSISLIVNLYNNKSFLKEGNIKDIFLKMKGISLLKNSSLDIFIYYLSLLFKPSHNDIYFVNLDDKLYFLYYLIRPIRLLVNVFKK